ncbi:uncharacterized protein LOC123429815 isoform X1 [Hordeum vulgare subsp. vulgare]|uniref:uncharacterized protein LOC123429815 isoform X1 n=1 Tax=Hordeum vulgare subsp. vulgare TaxID=112509 RepID=UPI001D1A35EB|nr:uncharacterized protein LOC123429815 isoform X1 [Hordeum vulgare subsp. vulgare]
MRACGSGSGGEGRGGRHRVTSVTLSMLGEKPDLVCDRATCSGRRREPKTLNKRSEPPLPPHVAIRRRRRNPVRGAAESSTSAEESRWLAALSEPELDLLISQKRLACHPLSPADYSPNAKFISVLSPAVTCMMVSCFISILSPADYSPNAKFISALVAGLLSLLLIYVHLRHALGHSVVSVILQIL